MTDIRATIAAAALDEHVWDHGGDTYCQCGWDGWDDSSDIDVAYRDHQAAAVLAALDADPRVVGQQCTAVYVDYCVRAAGHNGPHLEIDGDLFSDEDAARYAAGRAHRTAAEQSPGGAP